jgi:hypothetical protein
MFHGRGTDSPSSVAKRTHAGWHTRVTQKGPSQLGESLFMPSRLRIRRNTRSFTCIFNSRLPPSLVD